MSFPKPAVGVYTDFKFRMATPAQPETRRQDDGPEPASLGPHPNLKDNFEIWLPGGALPVRILYAAIRELKRASFEENDEQTGLLLGSSSRQCVLIQRFELLPFSPEQSASLGSLIQARIDESREGGLSVVGFFRAEKSGWRGLNESDRKLVKQYLPGSGAVFALIQTPAHRPWTASLSVFNGDAPSVDIPFDEYFLRNGYVGPPVERALPPPSVQRKANIREIVVTFAIALLIAFAVAAAVLAYVWPRSPEPSDLPETAPLTASMLGFKVNRSGSDFEVSWDRSSSAVQRAVSGTFTIRDGGFTKTVPLSPAQLREARIVYSPLLGDLDFRLEIATSDHRTQAESVQVLGWTANPALATPLPASTPPVRPGATAVPAGKSVQTGSTPPVSPMKVISPAITARTPAAVAPAAASKATGSLPAGTKPAQNISPVRPGDAGKAPSGAGTQKSTPSDGKKTQAPSASK
jgi:hypothetical protein